MDQRSGLVCFVQALKVSISESVENIMRIPIILNLLVPITITY